MSDEPCQVPAAFLSTFRLTDHARMEILDASRRISAPGRIEYQVVPMAVPVTAHAD
ncbi:MAG: hypothetical protein J7575_08060 [Chloroflexi bacterium]|jgi:hypothetical protein|nr:hypothetical protein [Chloroflexota bacterium]